MPSVDNLAGSAADLQDDSHGGAQMVDRANANDAVVGDERARSGQLADSQREGRTRDMVRELDSKRGAAGPDRETEIGADAEVHGEYRLRVELIFRKEELLTTVADDNDGLTI